MSKNQRTQELSQEEESIRKVTIDRIEKESRNHDEHFEKLWIFHSTRIDIDRDFNLQHFLIKWREFKQRQYEFIEYLEYQREKYG